MIGGITKEKFMKTIQEFERTARPDNRPVTGFLGQNCLGYLTLPSGKVVCVVPKDRGAEFLGPGTYTPEKPNTFTKSIKLADHQRTYVTSRPQHSVGPADHPMLPSPTRILHKIGEKRPGERPRSFLSGNLTHASWSSPLPSYHREKRRFPMLKLDKKPHHNTRHFVGSMERHLFEKCEVNDLMYNPIPERMEENYEITKQSAVFRSEAPRTNDPISTTPAPCHYNIPSTFGTGRKTGLEDTWGEVDVDPPLPTPGPGYYDVPKPKGGPAMSFRRSDPVDWKPEEVPGPGSYEPEFAGDDRIPPAIRRKDMRKSEDWCRTPSMITETPAPGHYDVVPPWKGKGGLMNTIGHKDTYMSEREATESDHKLGFRTLHTGLMKRTPNCRYGESIERSMFNV